jgi:parvulin-like peptidyl-prolyl isomerase
MRARWSIAAALAVGVVCAGQIKAQAPAAAKPAAVVNGVVIPVADVEAVLKARGPFPPDFPETKRREVQFVVVSTLIDDVLLQQFLSKNAKPADNGEIAKQIADLEAALKKQGNTLQDFCKETGQTEDRLRLNVARYLQWTAYVQSHQSDAEVKRCYEENRDFFDGTTVRVSHIMMKVSPTADDGARKEARDKLLAIRAHILAGKLDFADGAKRFSQTESAKNGGDLGFFQRKGDIEEPFAKAAFSMKVGEVSDVVQTEFGYHLLKVTERKEGKPSEFEKIKERVREFFVYEMREEVLAQMRKVSKIEINAP